MQEGRQYVLLYMCTDMDWEGNEEHKLFQILGVNISGLRI